MLCSNCGSKLPDNAVFCPNCGQSVLPDAPKNQPGDPTATNEAVTVPGNGLGIASMVLGILSLVFMCIFYLGIPMSIIGLVLGAVSIHKAKAVNMKNGMAVAGVTCSIISIVLYAVLIILYGFILMTSLTTLFGQSISDLWEMLSTARIHTSCL
ncbi:MAG TPA: hypothetical protein DEW22_00150 [Clostridiales bacterium]|nr:zinc-ribbon domain-containing protein [Clostridiales bacterium]HCG67085.1 hypothetical protein [Clostridiales bacterium]